MYAFIARRLILMIPTVVIITMVVFFVTSWLPGDAALARLGEEQGQNDEAYQALRRELGLDRPIAMQYLSWAGDAVRGDFGVSSRNQPVSEMLRQRIPRSAQIGLFSMLLSLSIALPAGIISATRPGSFIDRVVTLIALSGVAIPNFWLAAVLVYIFALRLGWLPASGWATWSDLATDPGRSIKVLILPAFVLGTATAAATMRHLRTALVDALQSNYVQTARSKGLAPRQVLFSHALKNAMIPVITILGLQIGGIMSGTIIVETMFGVPGLGRMTVDAIVGRDLPVLQAGVLFATLLVVLANLATDILYAVLDPRIRYS